MCVMFWAVTQLSPASKKVFEGKHVSYRIMSERWSLPFRASLPCTHLVSIITIKPYIHAFGLLPSPTW